MSADFTSSTGIKLYDHASRGMYHLVAADGEWSISIPLDCLAAIKEYEARSDDDGAFEVGDKVTHTNFGGNSDIVFGHVTATDSTAEQTQVRWADGSGPTWHPSSALQLIDPA